MFRSSLPLLALATVLVLSACTSASRQTHSAHRVVMEVSSDEPKVWEAMMNNVENLQKAFGSERAEIKVVAHGGGLGMLMKTNEAQVARLTRISAAGVVLAACENTMQRKHVTRDALFPFVSTVDSGVAEVVRRQEEGWSYVKSGF